MLFLINKQIETSTAQCVWAGEGQISRLISEVCNSKNNRNVLAAKRERGF